MKDILSTIEELTELDVKTLTERALKLNEEAGEVGGAVLSYTNASGCGYKDMGKDDVIEECADVFIVLRSLLCQVEATDDEFEDKIRLKLKKWEKVIEK